MRRLSAEMDRLFGEFGIRSLFPLRPREDFEAVWTPHPEVIEKPGETIVRVDLPGLTKDRDGGQRHRRDPEDRGRAQARGEGIGRDVGD
ncbi:MAG TPA: hypothetical protein VNK41_12445 [Vicinamibacterales bacterium]|nr:hypothetical protein [Vicinamibacterales bacterium]